MLKTHKFARKPFYVDAVRVSENNIEEVAQWCEGTIETEDNDVRFIRVEVHRPINERQTQAYIGDWVLKAGSGFKVYTPKAFDKSFEKVKYLTKEQADAAGITVPHEPRQPKKPVGPKGPSPMSIASRAKVTPPKTEEDPVHAEPVQVAIDAETREPVVPVGHKEVQVMPGITMVVEDKDDDKAAREAVEAARVKKLLG